MYINEDYSCVGYDKKKLIEAGYGNFVPHSLHFDHYVSDEQKEENRKFFEGMTDKQRNEYFASPEFETVQQNYSKQLENTIVDLDGKFNVHQFRPENSTMEHYSSDWDLFFWSDRGWNNKDYMTCCSLTLNEKRSAESNQELLENILPMLDQSENLGVMCRVQYAASLDMEKLDAAAYEVFNKINGKFIELYGAVGKVRIVQENNGMVRYGFFKKGAKSKYFTVTSSDLVAMDLAQ